MVAMKAWFIKPPSPSPAGGIESIIQIERRRGTDRDASSGLEIVGRSSYTYNRRRTLSLGSWSCGCSLIIAALYQKLSTADATQPHSRWQIPSSDQEEPSHNAPNEKAEIKECSDLQGKTRCEAAYKLHLCYNHLKTLEAEQRIREILERTEAESEGFGPDGSDFIDGIQHSGESVTTTKSE